MVFPKRKEIRAIYTTFLSDGTFVVKKDWSAKHETAKIENVKVYKILKSLASKGFATEVHNWGYFYYVIKEAGVNFVKNYLGFTEDRIQPATFRAKAEVKTGTSARDQGSRLRGRTTARGGKAATEGQQEGAPAQTEPAKEE